MALLSSSVLNNDKGIHAKGIQETGKTDLVMIHFSIKIFSSEPMSIFIR